MSKTTIYYFSATGNSLAVARDLAHLLDVGEPISVPGSLVNKDPYVDSRGAKAVGFVFPVQRATIPEMLRGFLQSMPIDPQCYYFAVSTYSLFGSNEFWDIDDLLTQKNARLNYAAEVHMMGNVGFMRPSEAIIEQRLAQMDKQIDEIATAVAYHQENYFPRSNQFLGKIVRSYTNMRRKRIVFRIDKRCKKCGICSQVCPAQNIQPPAKDSSAGPIRSDKCEACMACVHWCPAAAISTSRRKHVSYHNPRVAPEDLHPVHTGVAANGHTMPQKPLPEKPSDIDSIKPDAELAATLRDDLLAPADLENWLNDSKAAQRKKDAAAMQAPTIIAPGALGMSQEEISEALAELDS